MPIRSRLASQDCIDEYLHSAEARIESGFKLLADSDAIGVSLLGEAAEMYLKSTYFTFVKAAFSDPVTPSDLTAAKQEAAIFGVTEQPESYHNLRFWADLVVAKRANALAQSVSTPDEVELCRAAARLSTNWNITDRYKNIQGAASAQDLLHVLEDALVIQAMYVKLRK